MLSPNPDARPSGAAEVIDALHARQTGASWSAGTSDVATFPHLNPERPARQVKGATRRARPTAPTGSWSVVVRERHADQPRRHRLRATISRWRRLTRTTHHHEPPQDAAAEHALVAAVARATGDTDLELATPEAVFLPEFTFLEGTDEATARSIAAAAEREGFAAVATRTSTPLGLTLATAAHVGVGLCWLVVLSVLGFAFMGLGAGQDPDLAPLVSQLLPIMMMVPALVFAVDALLNVASGVPAGLTWALSDWAPTAFTAPHVGVRVRSRDAAALPSRREVARDSEPPTMFASARAQVQAPSARDR